MRDIVGIKIPRRGWCDKPYFEDAVEHVFVRLEIGRYAKTQSVIFVCV